MDNRMTSGERCFIQLCKKHGFKFRSIIAEDNSRTPDYEVNVGGYIIFVEIKDFEINKEEKVALETLQADRCAVWGSSKVGNRVRNKIEDASDQLKNNMVGASPAILILFDNRPEQISLLSTYEIAVAMYGFQTIDLNSRGMKNQRFGAKAQMSTGTRTYISAIGVLRTNLTLDLFENYYAKNRLDINILTGCSDISMFRLSHSPRDKFSDWEQVLPA